MAQLRLILLLNNKYPSKVLDKEFEKFLKYKSGLNIEQNVKKDIKYNHTYMNDRPDIIASKLKRLLKILR